MRCHTVSNALTHDQQTRQIKFARVHGVLVNGDALLHAFCTHESCNKRLVGLVDVKIRFNRACVQRTCAWWSCRGHQHVLSLCTHRAHQSSHIHNDNMNVHKHIYNLGYIIWSWEQQCAPGAVAVMQRPCCRCCCLRRAGRRADRWPGRRPAAGCGGPTLAQPVPRAAAGGCPGSAPAAAGPASAPAWAVQLLSISSSPCSRPRQTPSAVPSISPPVNSLWPPAQCVVQKTPVVPVS